MLKKSDSIILKTVKYGDSQLIIDMLTLEYGRMSVVWKMPRKRKGSVGPHIFQPLTIVQMECEQKSQKGLPLLKECHISSPYYSIYTDPVKMSVCFFVAEFLVLVTKAEQSDSLFYSFVENSLKWYDVADSATANFHLMFLVRASKFLGFYPNMETYSEGYFFDLKAAEFVPSMPLHRDALQPSEAALVSVLMRMTPSNMHLFRFSRTERNRAVEVMLRFYSLHIPGFREMKSWDVLKEIFR